MKLDTVVVVGASLAGLTACDTLRKRGYEGRVILLGAEEHLPYDRPPLSKKLLSNAWDTSRILLRTEDALRDLNLDLRLGSTALALDTERRVVQTTGGDVAYDGLIIATGAVPRRLHGLTTYHGVFELRTLQDSLQLRERLVGDQKRLTVVGAGFIGLEVAATARQLGCEVVVLEAGPAPLMRGLGEHIGRAAASMHGRRGVAIRCGMSVTDVVPAVATNGNKHLEVRLATGEALLTDTVVIGVGARPATDWLEGSGLYLQDGVVCDATLNAGAPGVYAAGDCARWPNPWLEPHDDALTRLEHWSNAVEQGAAAAASLLDTAAGSTAMPFSSVPYVWSDQYDSNIQLIGHPHGGDEVQVVAGSLDGPFAAIYGYEGRLRAAVAVDMPRALKPFRKLLPSRASFDDALGAVSALAV